MRIGNGQIVSSPTPVLGQTALPSSSLNIGNDSIRFTGHRQEKPPSGFKKYWRKFIGLLQAIGTFLMRLSDTIRNSISRVANYTGLTTRKTATKDDHYTPSDAVKLKKAYALPSEYLDQSKLDQLLKALEPDKRLALIGRHKADKMTGTPPFPLTGYLFQKYIGQIQEKNLDRLASALVAFYDSSFYMKLLASGVVSDRSFPDVSQFKPTINDEKKAKALVQTLIQHTLKAHKAGEDFPTILFGDLSSEDPFMMAKVILDEASGVTGDHLLSEELSSAYTYLVRDASITVKEKYLFYKDAYNRDKFAMDKKEQLRNMRLFQQLSKWEKEIDPTNEVEKALFEKERDEFCTTFSWIWGLGPDTRSPYIRYINLRNSIRDRDDLNQPVVSAMQDMIDRKMDFKTYQIYDPKLKHNKELQAVLEQFRSYQGKRPEIIHIDLTGAENSLQAMEEKFEEFSKKMIANKDKPSIFLVDLDLNNLLLTKMILNRFKSAFDSKGNSFNVEGDTISNFDHNYFIRFPVGRLELYNTANGNNSFTTTTRSLNSRIKPLDLAEPISEIKA